MWKIITLDKNLANQISAWEVVERPISIVKEIIENSVDAWSNFIKVEIKNWWKDEIIITDNWEWISKEDLPKSIEKYATSKIKSLKDLYNVLTFGFRWEALASIASVSKMTIISKNIDSDLWYKMEVSWWDILWISEYPSEVWTKIIIKDLFFNTPARLNYLKTDKTEYSHISEFMNNVALAYPEIWFELVNEWKIIFKYWKQESLPIRIYNIYGEDFSEKLTDIECEVLWVKISWYISRSMHHFWNKNRQILFVNNRVVKNPIIFRAIQNAYNRFIPHWMNPAYIIKIDVDPTEVDVNVHPRKMEVRFANEQDIFKSVYSAISQKLDSESLVEQNLWTEIKPLNQIKTDNFNPEKMQRFYSSWSWEKFKSYSPYKEINFNPSQTNLNNEINFQDKFEDENEEKIKDLHDTPLWKIIWQIHNSYIVVEWKEWIRIFDQHALAERILYEKLVSNDVSIKSQWLLISVSFNVTPKELSILKENEEEIINTGFDFEIINDKIIIINWIPNFVKEKDIENVFLWTIEDIWEENARSMKTIWEVYNKVFATIACRSSIKFWDKLNLFEMNKLLSEAEKYYASTCPHWRWVEFKMNLNELKKKFDR